jgi:hypothetical protein
VADISHALAVLTVVAALTSLGFAIAVASYLRSKGHAASPLLVKWMVFHYMAMYKRVTLEETGRIGPLYIGCMSAVTAALVLAIAALVTLRLG